MLRKCLCILLASVLISVCTVTVSAADSETLAALSFPNDSAVPEENLSVNGYGDKDSGYATSTVGARVFASVSGTDYRKLEWSKGEYGESGMQPVMTGGTKNPWGSGAFLEVRLSTKGYEAIRFSASLGATKKGPRDYKLQISTDGVNFTDVAGAFFTVSVNKTMYKAFDDVALPAMANDADMLYIRIAVASNMLVNNTAGLIGSTGGETAINDITVGGTPIATTTAKSDTQTTADRTTAITTTASSPTASSSADTDAQTNTTASAQTTTTLHTDAGSAHTGDNPNGIGIAALLMLLAVASMVGIRRIRI